MLDRKTNPIFEKMLHDQYHEHVNANNISSLSYIKLRKIFKNEDLISKNIYLHNVISLWIDQNFHHDFSFIRKLKWIIFKSKIILNQKDKYELNLLEERVFAFERNLKIIDVKEKLNKNENVWAKYENGEIYYHNSRLQFWQNVQILITNLGIVLIDKKTSKDYHFLWKNINSYGYYKFGFGFSIGAKRYLLRIHDQITLNNTIKNYIHRKKRLLLKKDETFQKLNTAKKVNVKYN